MTAYADFLDLQTAVIKMVRRPDIADVMPQLVVMAEAEFNDRLRCRQQMASVVITIANGQGPLPADFLEPIGLFDTNGQEYIQASVQLVEDGRDRGHYAIVGDDLLCNSDGDKTLSYYAQIPTISESMTDSNWLLAARPALYLYGVGYEAAKHVQNTELAQLVLGLREAAFTATAAADAAARFGRASVRLRGVTP